MEHEQSSSEEEAFNPYDKERALRAESTRWDTRVVHDAEEGDIPVIDLAPYFLADNVDLLHETAAKLRDACERTGFFITIGHQVPQKLVEDMFVMVRRFHALDEATKQSLLMDQPGRVVGGAGYLPFQNRKLPTRDKGNLNEAFIVKADDKIQLTDNPWPDEQTLPGFRKTVESYAQAMTDLGHKLLPLFATALDVPCDFFQEAFVKPTYRLRMTHYPPAGETSSTSISEETKSDSESFGIAPHVDTSFCTILAQDSPGLTIFSEERKAWIRAPLVPQSFIVNGGELLRHWTNDRFLSVKHFANNNNHNTALLSRYSIPFFFNANQHYLMRPIPTCVSDTNPMKYAVISYSQSQAIAQGE